MYRGTLGGVRFAERLRTRVFREKICHEGAGNLRVHNILRTRDRVMLRMGCLDIRA